MLLVANKGHFVFREHCFVIYDRTRKGTPNLNMNGHLRTTGKVNYAENGIHQVNQKTSWKLGYQVNQKTSWRQGHQVNQKTNTDLVIRIRFYRLL